MAVPNYYDILSLPFDPKLTPEEIRTAYKRASLLTHPDRNPNLSEPERRQATERFQQVADAYYILSDPTRRKEYIEVLKNQRPEEAFHPQSNTNGSKNSSFEPMNFFKTYFSNQSKSAGPEGNNQQNMRPDPEATFADVFEDMLKTEIERTEKTKRWRYLGTASGATLGFIVGNLPGLAVGSLVGNRLGAVRDAKGKSVYEVFSQLETDQKTIILKALALKVLGFALS